MLPPALGGGGGGGGGCLVPPGGPGVLPPTAGNALPEELAAPASGSLRKCHLAWPTSITSTRFGKRCCRTGFSCPFGTSLWNVCHTLASHLAGSQVLPFGNAVKNSNSSFSASLVSSVGLPEASSLRMASGRSRGNSQTPVLPRASATSTTVAARQRILYMQTASNTVPMNCSCRQRFVSLSQVKRRCSLVPDPIRRSANDTRFSSPSTARACW